MARLLVARTAEKEDRASARAVLNQHGPSLAGRDRAHSAFASSPTIACGGNSPPGRTFSRSLTVSGTRVRLHGAPEMEKEVDRKLNNGSVASSRCAPAPSPNVSAVVAHV